MYIVENRWDVLGVKQHRCVAGYRVEHNLMESREIWAGKTTY